MGLNEKMRQVTMEAGSGRLLFVVEEEKGDYGARHE